jgi:hypothetical protein
MPRVDPEAFDEREVTPVFVAATLAEAMRVEHLLTERGVNYLVSVEPVGSTLFGSTRHGALFSVLASQALYCASLLTDAGLGYGVLVDDASDPNRQF